MSITTHFMVSPVEADSEALLPYWKEFDWTYADAVSGLTIYFPVVAGSFILDVAVQVTVTINGTAQDIDGVGDAAGAVTWIADANITATAGVIINSRPAETNKALGGKYYAANTYIKITLAAADATAGAGKLWMLMSGLEA